MDYELVNVSLNQNIKIKILFDVASSHTHVVTGWWQISVKSVVRILYPLYPISNL